MPMDTNTQAPPLRLRAEAEAESYHLRMRYSLVNDRRRPIWVFNVLWDLDREGAVVRAPRPAYACLMGGSTLHVALRILPLPRHRTVEARVMPFATRVMPGEAYETDLALPLPVREHNFYFPAREETRWRTVLAREVLLSVDVVPDFDGLLRERAPMSGSHRLSHPELLSKVVTLWSDPLPLAVPAELRLDAFDRF
jgi:hypothetical protein